MSTKLRDLFNTPGFDPNKCSHGSYYYYDEDAELVRPVCPLAKLGELKGFRPIQGFQNAEALFVFLDLSADKAVEFTTAYDEARRCELSSYEAL